MLRWLSSVRASLLILVLLAIIPAVGLSLYNAGERRQQDAENAQREALALTRLVSSHQESLISEMRQSLSFLARQPEVRGGDVETCSAYLADELEQKLIYSGIAVADLNGEVYCSAPPISEPVSVANRSHFQGALQTNDFTIGNYQIGLITGRGVLPFGFPVHDGQGNLRGVALAGLDLRWLNEFISSSDLPPDTTMTVVDRNGVILARYPEGDVSPGQSIAQRPLFQQMVATEKEGVGEATGLDGVPRLYAFSHLGDRGQSGEVYVSIGIPKSVAYAAANQALQRYLLGLGAVLFLTLGIAWFGADFLMMRRVRGLVAATQKLASGDFKSRSGFPHHSGEFGLLAEAFDGMAQELEEREEERAERIREQVRRTEAEAAQERITNILESIKDGFFAVDHQGRFTFLNQNAAQVMQKLTGQTVEETIGKEMWEEVPDFSGTHFYQECQRAIARQVSVQFEEFCPRLKVWLEVHAHPNRDGLSIFFQDITERKQAEEAKARLAAIVESAEDAIVSHDLEGVITSWNRGAVHLYSYSGEEAIGQPVTMLMPPERQHEGSSILRRIRQGEFIDHYETVRRRKDGTLLDVSLTVSPIINPHGHIEGVSKIARDITDRKRAEQALNESEERFRTMVNRLPLLVWMHDTQGNQQFVNQTFCQFFGVTEEQMRNGRWQMLMHPEDAESYANEFIACVSERRPFHAYVRVRRADGQWRWFESWGNPRFSPAGEYLGFIGASADITERKQTEEALLEADRQKDQFLAVLSHELRNPLAPIANAVELLYLDPGDPSVQQEALSVLDRQVHTITRLINDLLEVSRVTTGRIQLQQEHVDLNALVLSVADSFRRQMADRKIEFSVSLPSDPLGVHGDPTRLEQVISNLLSNAAKFTPPGGQVWLTLTEDQGRALIQVKDSGIGIEAKLLPHIFELFSQGESPPDRAEGGLGIGLSLVKTLVEVHGGSVTARSGGPGQGSEFLVRIPTLEAPAAASESLPEDSAEAATPALKVLLVDDAADTRKVFGRLLERLGNQVRTAENGLSALEVSREFQPEVVLLDIGLPGMDGYEVARRMRQEPALQKAVLVAVTGYGQQSDRQCSREAGFNHHLVKPIDIGALEQLFTGIAAARTA